MFPILPKLKLFLKIYLIFVCCVGATYLGIISFQKVNMPKHIDKTDYENSSVRYLFVKQQELFEKHAVPIGIETPRCFGENQHIYFDNKCELLRLSDEEKPTKINLFVANLSQNNRVIKDIKQLQSHYILKVSNDFYEAIYKNKLNKPYIYVVQFDGTNKKYLVLDYQFELKQEPNSEKLSSPIKLFYGKVKSKENNFTAPQTINVNTPYNCKINGEKELIPCKIYKFSSSSETFDNAKNSPDKDIITLTNWVGDLNNSNTLFVELLNSKSAPIESIKSKSVEIYYQKDTKLATIEICDALYGSLGVTSHIYYIDDN